MPWDRQRPLGARDERVVEVQHHRLAAEADADALDIGGDGLPGQERLGHQPAAGGGKQRMRRVHERGLRRGEGHFHL